MCLQYSGLIIQHHNNSDKQVIITVLKGIFSHFNSTFLWHKSEDINKKTGISKISVNSDFSVYNLCMIMCIDSPP